MELDDDLISEFLMEKGGAERPAASDGAIDRRTYFRELFRLQGELVELQDWVIHKGLKLVVIFEGRDAAGKGGAIKRMAQRLNPRVCRVAALPAPNVREKTQWYFQRYVSHLPAAGEIVFFDRSWYNRAGVERVMGFCSDDDVEEFFRSVPEFEKMLVRSSARTFQRPPGGWWKEMTRSGRGSTAWRTCSRRSLMKRCRTPRWCCRHGFTTPIIPGCPRPRSSLSRTVIRTVRSTAQSPSGRASQTSGRKALL